MTMVESIGKQLSHARHKKGLTVDEAAHATKLRPDKILALENDDYGRFANNIYARGFLQIYGRFLDVDVSEFARTLDNANPISVNDYQYLSNAPVARETATPERRERERPSLAPLIFFVALIAVGLAGTWLYANYQRIIGTPATTATRATVPAEAEGAADAAPNPVGVTGKPPGPKPRVTAVQRPTKPIASEMKLNATPELARAADQDVVSPTPVTTSDQTARSSPPGGVNEVLIASVKKTWVTVRKDDPKATPIFEDYVYPNANPLKLKGPRFFIDARDPKAVQITKNGLPFTYQTPAVPVQ